MGWNFAAELARLGPAKCVRPASAAAGRAYCARVVRARPENFVVTSVMLPRRILRHFDAVYAFCRWADDLADETSGGTAALDLLAWWRGELLACYSGTPHHPVTVALSHTIRHFAIPAEPFLALLSAFEQDQRVKEYGTFAELLDYCRRSANPVGHLVLYLFRCFDPGRAALADEICTGLQLANFWQDVSRDWDIGRVYLPREDRVRFGYADADLQARRFTPAFRDLIWFEVDRTRGYFARGEALLPLLPPEAKPNVALFLRGGRAVLDAIERQKYDVWRQRPSASRWAKARTILGTALGK